jgi:hypothetical protein
MLRYEENLFKKNFALVEKNDEE